MEMKERRKYPSYHGRRLLLIVVLLTVAWLITGEASPAEADQARLDSLCAGGVGRFLMSGGECRAGSWHWYTEKEIETLRAEAAKEHDERAARVRRLAREIVPDSEIAEMEWAHLKPFRGNGIWIVDPSEEPRLREEFHSLIRQQFMLRKIVGADPKPIQGRLVYPIPKCAGGAPPPPCAEEPKP